MTKSEPIHLPEEIARGFLITEGGNKMQEITYNEGGDLTWIQCFDADFPIKRIDDAEQREFLLSALEGAYQIGLVQGIIKQSQRRYENPLE